MTDAVETRVANQEEVINRLRKELEAAKGWIEAGEWADYYWHQYINAGTLSEQATAFEHLSNHMFEVRTFLPGYDYEHDTLPWQRGEEG